MHVAERLARREESWRALDALLGELDGGRRLRKAGPDEIHRLGALYRDACADLMLAEAHDLPAATVAYLHDLVARAHAAIYRTRGLGVSEWAGALFADVPRRLRTDPAVRLAALAFFGTFLAFAALACARPGFAARVLGETAVAHLEQMYAEPSGGPARRNDATMAGFYVRNNAGIGLRCFAWGLAFGLGSLYILLTNALTLGASFGHMATTAQAGRFFAFVTAHAPFELTAIVLAGAAGMRMGWGLIDSEGFSRAASLRRSARSALPIVGTSVVLFVLAAFLEGFVSASPLPYPAKAGIALACAGLLGAYVLLGGHATGS